jgi:hypothetical protein
VNVDLNVGDPVKLVSDGTVALAAAGDSIYGVITGVAPYYDGTTMVFNNKLPGGTTYGSVLERTSYVYVLPVAGLVFEVDCDENTTATTQAAYTAFIEENCDLSLNADATTKQARPLLDISTHVTTTAQWRIYDLSRRIDQDFSGTRVKLLVVCNEVQQAPYVTTGV